MEADEDWRILAHLIGGTPDRSNWSAQAGETWAAVHRYRHVERHPEKTNAKIRG